MLSPGSHSCVSGISSNPTSPPSRARRPRRSAWPPERRQSSPQPRDRAGEDRQAWVARIVWILARAPAERENRAPCVRHELLMLAAVAEPRARTTPAIGGGSGDTAAAYESRSQSHAIIVDCTTMSTFNRLLGFLRPYKRGLAASWALASVAMVMTVLLPYLTGLAVEAITHGAEHARRHQLTLQAHDRHTLLILALVIRRRRPAPLGDSPTHDECSPGGISLGIEYDLRQLHLRPPPAARARLLRPPADRPADVPRDRRSAGRPLLPRLRPRLHPAIGPRRCVLAARP